MYFYLGSLRFKNNIEVRPGISFALREKGWGPTFLKKLGHSVQPVQLFFDQILLKKGRFEFYTTCLDLRDSSYPSKTPNNKIKQFTTRLKLNIRTALYLFLWIFVLRLSNQTR